ncbi:hypothetical protein Z949_1057 [Sulfitobacter guttiformis KCTC 32187]|nr:hypothetical protein Z949_1057 [Sulfitobacter guttiformis KCTC 32187]
MYNSLSLCVAALTRDSKSIYLCGQFCEAIMENMRHFNM